MKVGKSAYHVAWYITLVLAIALVVVKSSLWWVPLILYLVASFLSIVIAAILRGKIMKMPYYMKKAFKVTIQEYKK